MIVEAKALLRSAAREASPGRFRTEAAIPSLHAHRRITGGCFTESLARPYGLLAQFAPTTGILVARAVAYARNGDPSAASRQLDRIGDAPA